MSNLSIYELLEKTTWIFSQREVASHLGVTREEVNRWLKRKPEIPQSYRYLLEEMLPQKPQNEEPEFRFIDLFAGIGGIRKGFEKHGGECVFTSEWNEYSQKTYSANFYSEHEINGDITQIDPFDILDHDVLLAGFPCQPFSIAGVSKKNSLGQAHGFECKTQGTLFFNVAKILETKCPSAFMLENVKNLKGHDKGRTYKIIMETLRELGYTLVESRIIDGQHFVPQHRERIIIVGFRHDTGFRWSDLDLPEQGPTVGSILEDTESVSDKYVLSQKLWKYLKDYKAKHEAKGNGFGYGLVKPDSVARTLSARYYKDGSEILVSRGRKNPRRLTPRECSRLMGFDLPDGSEFKIPVSDTQAYKQFGNSVVVPVIEEVARIMKPHILANMEIEADSEEQLRLAV